MSFFIISACQVSSKTPIEPVAGKRTPSPFVLKETPSPTATATGTFVVPPSFTPTPTNTATFITPIWTPQPTLSPEEAERLILDLLENNAGCQLPCWWGFTPGQTTWEEAKRLLETIASNIYIGLGETFSYAEVIIPVPEEVYPIYPRQYYTIKNSVVEMIEVNVGFLPDYSLSALLSNYGEPSNVLISTYNKPVENYMFFKVIYFFPKAGILAASVIHASLQGETIQACPKQDSQLELALGTPAFGLTIQEAIQKSWRIKGLFETDPYWLDLETATGMSISEFFQRFSEARNDWCFETPADLWPAP